MCALLWSETSVSPSICHRLVVRTASSTELTLFLVTGNYNLKDDECYCNNQENQTHHNQSDNSRCQKW